MQRNLDRRVEVVVPVLSPKLRHEIRDETLQLILEDNCHAWELQPDGCYQRRQTPPIQNRKNAQQILLERFANA